MKRRLVATVLLVALAACGSSTTPASTNPLDEALKSLGVDLDRAPPAATDLGQATFCGYEVRGLGRPQESNLNEVARRCFLDHYSSSRAAIFVASDLTTEGDPIVTIYRWGSDGRLEIFVDATRDSFGSGKWEAGTCTGVTTEFPNAPEPLPAYYFDGDGCGAMAPASA